MLVFLVALAFLTPACKQKAKSGDLFEKQIQALSDKVIAARKEIAGLETLEGDVENLENRVNDIRNELEGQNARDRATGALAVHHVAVMEVPDILPDVRKVGPLKLGFISMRIRAPWEEAVAVVAELESYSELAIDSVELTPDTLSTDVTAIIAMTYAADISSGEAQISTEEITLPLGAPPHATPEYRVAELEKMLTTLQQLKMRRIALEKKRDALNGALDAYENWEKTKPRPSLFLKGLSARWPIGIPTLSKVVAHSGIITVYTNGQISEISPFLLEFLKEIKSLAAPFEINLNPLIGNMLDGRSLDLSERNGKVEFSWKELPVLDLPSSSVLSLARGRDKIYYVTPLRPATFEEGLKSRKWSPRPARSLRAVIIESREMAWEMPFSPPQEITNLIIEPKGRLVYGSGKSLYFLSPENGKTALSLPLEADALEIALGAWDRLIVRCRRGDGKEEWITITLPGE